MEQPLRPTTLLGWVKERVCRTEPSGLVLLMIGIPKKWIMIPSGKRLHNYGKSPFLIGKLTINGHVQ